MTTLWTIRLALVWVALKLGFSEYASREVGRWFKWQGRSPTWVRLKLRAAGHDV